MTEQTEQTNYLPLRKKDTSMSADEAWELLCAPRVTYGILGTAGVAAEGNMPYAVPMNFAADKEAGTILMHCTLDAKSKRNRALAENPKATFVVVDPDSHISTDASGLACKCTMSRASVMVFGTVEKVEVPAEKARALNLMMKQKSGMEKFVEVNEMLSSIATIYALKVEHITSAKKV
jgi:nitroimidazol reductase NimA-like FMN-containing flavoprotein (pyridoxamine 5'-phosphate oxidase superfamily)